MLLLNNRRIIWLKNVWRGSATLKLDSELEESTIMKTIKQTLIEANRYDDVMKIIAYIINDTNKFSYPLHYPYIDEYHMNKVILKHLYV